MPTVEEILKEHVTPAFIKIGTYASFPIRVCINGHEWAKRQLGKKGGMKILTVSTTIFFLVHEMKRELSQT